MHESPRRSPARQALGRAYRGWYDLSMGRGTRCAKDKFSSAFGDRRGLRGGQRSDLPPPPAVCDLTHDERRRMGLIHYLGIKDTSYSHHPYLPTRSRTSRSSMTR